MARHFRKTVTILTLALYGAQMIVLPLVLANPVGPNVVAGDAKVSGIGTSQVIIQQNSAQAIINWQQFNITPNEVTRFIQPDIKAIALNRIFDQNPSQIFGRLQANGTVILQNRNGIFFGKDAQVNVGGLVATSLNLSNADFLLGHYLFQGTGIEGPVKNAGMIHGTAGVYLLAPNVENSGVITSAGGNIVLAAGATAFLSNRPDGQGFLAEISNLVGHAVNLKDLIADGGNITMAGRVVNQEGLVQANSVRERSGKIELYASETLTLKAGSRMEAKGGQADVSDGGSIKAIADLKSGTASFEQGAVVDISGGARGGQGGFFELSAHRVNANGQVIGMSQVGYKGGTFLIDPTFVNLSGLSTMGLSDNPITSLFGEDLHVTGQFDLANAVPPSTGQGTIRFEAGRDLLFENAFLTHSGSTDRLWNISATAERSILFSQSVLSTNKGGSITLNAKTGDVSLVDSSIASDALNGITPISTVRAIGGGDINIFAGRNLIASTDLVTSPLSDFKVIAGIHLEGTGRLNIDVKGDFVGGKIDGRQTGPGFVIRNTDLSVTPLHTVKVGGTIGETNLPLRADGLPDTTVPINPITGKPDPTLRVKESNRGYLDVALSNGDLRVEAGKNIYIRRVRDAGLLETEDPRSPGDPVIPQISPGFEKNSASFTSNTGHILINTDYLARPGEVVPENPLIPQVSSWLPASFTATSSAGTIQIRSDLKFLPSSTGSIRFDAKGNIEGVPAKKVVPDPNYDFFFVKQGPGVPPEGMWTMVDLRTVSSRRDIYPLITTDNQRIPKPRVENDPRVPKIEIDQFVPTISFIATKPSDLAGNPDLNGLTTKEKESYSSSYPLPGTAASGSAQFKAGGDITKLVLQLEHSPIPKEVSVEAGGDLSRVQISAYLANLGSTLTRVTEIVPLIRDAEVLRLARPGETVRPEDVVLSQPEPVDVPVPKVAATISANNISLTKTGEDSLFNRSGIFFYGPGSAKIIAKANLDLSDGKGIQLLPPFPVSGQRGGLLDISVGGNLKMDSSRIDSLNGAGISIHGLTEGTGYVMGYNNAALHPLEVPASLRGTLNEAPPVGGSVNIGGSQSPATALLDNQGPTGIKVVQGGSVGYQAQVASVGQDGRVTVMLPTDPTAIAIRAAGDINVFTSRVATLQGGNIFMQSVNGNINAGSGSRDEVTSFVIKQPKLDANGNPSPTEFTNVTYKVPGSGIFTYHPADPQPLVFKEFNDPEINALLAEATKATFFGRDASVFLNKANALKAIREPMFNATVKKPFIDSLKLGDITLVARNGRIIIPPAGIRGRNVTLDSPFLDFQGGTVSGNVAVPNPATAVGGTPSFSGTGTGAAATGVASVSGSSATASTAATSSAVSSSSKSTESVQESVTDSSRQQSEAKSKQVADKRDESKKNLVQSVRVKRGVVIQVDVKPQVQPGS